MTTKNTKVNESNNTLSKSDINDEHRKFKKFMKQFSVKGQKDIKATHTSMGSSKETMGSWHIPEDKYEEFIEKYSKLAGHVVLHIVERPLEVGPLLIDIDMNFEKDKKKRMYSKEHIINFINIVQKVIKDNIKLENIKELRAFVCEKPKPTLKVKKDEKNNLYKDGFHVVFPFLRLSIEQRTVIRELSKIAVIEAKIFDDLKANDKKFKEQDMDDIFDKAVIISNGWLLYKSQKADNNPYVLTHIFKSGGKAIDISKYTDSKLALILNNRKYGVLQNEYGDKADMDIIEQITIPSKMKLNKRRQKASNSDSDSDKDGEDHNLITLNRMMGISGNSNNESIEPTSIQQNNMQNPFNNTLQEIINSQNNSDSNTQSPNNQVTGVQGSNDANLNLLPNGKYKCREDIYIASRLVMTLSKKRATSYDDWVSVCWALTNIGKENKDDLYNTWIAFSKKSRSFDKESCKKVWKDATVRLDGYGLPTVHYWSKKDNPTAYANIMLESVSDLIIKITDFKDLTEESIANIAYNLYKYDYVCSSIEKKIWYEFKNHRWNKVECGASLREKMYKDVTRQLYEFIRAASSMCISSDGSSQEKVQSRMVNGLKHITKMGKTQFRENVMKECAYKFVYQDPTGKGRNFESILDDKVYLLGFSNGVYDLERMEFREGHPDDYLTFSVGYPYEDHSNSKYIKEINKYFEQVQPDEEMRMYVLTLLSTFLKGGNDLEQFIIWIGTGANGKSLTAKLLQEALGDYEGTLPSTFITTKQASSSSATPELEDKKGKRYIQINEPEKGEKIYCSSLKEKTSDKIMARGLYKNPIEYLPQFKCIVNCNDLLELSSNDGGVWRRIRVTRWVSEFVHVDKNGNHKDTGKKLEPQQFPRNDKLKDKIPLWAPTFMWMLINIYYRKFKEGNYFLHEPEPVKECTNQYRQTMDVFAKFIADVLLPESKKDGKGTPIKDIFEEYKDWSRDHVSNNKKQLTIPDFQKYLKENKYIVKKDKNKVVIVYGLKLKDDRDIKDEFEDSGEGPASN